jgi:hypothetical protein
MTITTFVGAQRDFGRRPASDIRPVALQLPGPGIVDAEHRLGEREPFGAGRAEHGRLNTGLDQASVRPTSTLPRVALE